MSAPLLIRADASAAIGSGHVMRCLALAQAWRRSGGRAVFAAAECPPGLEARLGREGFDLRRAPLARGGADDAIWTAETARELGAAWVVADGYEFGAGWLRAVADAGPRILLIDDCGRDDVSAATLVLNQNAGARAGWYPRKPDGRALLLGPKFALVREEFLALPAGERTCGASVRKVLVTLGGGDPDNATGRVLEALADLDGVEFTVVVGGSNPHRAAIEAAAARMRSPARMVVDAANMPELMAEADFAVAAAGSTTWELAYMGIPAVLVVIADNQRGIAAALAEAGAAVNLGDFRSFVPADLAAAVAALRDNPALAAEQARRGRALVDGYGASRVAAALGAPLRVTLLSDADSWLNSYLGNFVSELSERGCRVRWIHDPAELAVGDVAFFLSLSRLVPADLRRRHAHNLVVHESALPAGRGWSPLTWQVLEGKSEIPVTLLEAAEGADAGDIYLQSTITLRGDELVDELRAAQAAATLALAREFLDRYPWSATEGRAQTGVPSYYPRRRPADSRLDPDRTLRELFNQLRVADPVRYPAFCEIAGRRFEIRITPAPAPAPRFVSA